jgi:3-keto-5-aminohexanoate cleavage enzyme
MMSPPQPDLIINFAPTGMVATKEVTPHIPITATEIIEQVHEAYTIGITIAHVHARHADGTPAWEPEIYGPILDGIRRHCPDLVICVSLSGRSCGEFEKRSAVLQLHPDMGSLTLGSLNFFRDVSVNSPEMIQRLAEAMAAHGVVPELECFDHGMINVARYLAGKGVLRPPFYFNVIVGNMATAQADLTQVASLVHDVPPGAYWSLGGIGHVQLRANALAIVEGGGVRVGLEDNIWLDAARTQLATNTSLLRRIHELASVFGRRPMAPAALGALGFYNPHRPGAPS